VVNVNALLTGETIGPESRAADAWKRISEKPSSITIVRGVPKAAIAAQTVRVEYNSGNTGLENRGGAGVSSMQRVTVFGIRDHDTLADTDIRRDDQFAYDGLIFRVISVVKTIGEIQAKCEALG